MAEALDAPAVNSDGAEEASPEADVAQGCSAVADQTFYVDPLAAGDDERATGTRSCPFKTITEAFAAFGRAIGSSPTDGSAPAATVRIINDAAAPVIGTANGESFPLVIPPHVMLTADDPTKGTPTIVIPSSVGLASGITMSSDSALSHLIVDGAQQTLQGIQIGSVADPGVGAAMDHVTARSFTRFGIETSAGSLSTIGPGMLVQNNAEGLRLAGGQVTIIGGRGADHSSFTGNGSGVRVAQGLQRLTIPARPSIPKPRPSPTSIWTTTSEVLRSSSPAGAV